MTNENNVPAILTSLSEVLAKLKVDKNGVLPGNMGGKSYITAADAAAAVKTLFVEHDIVSVPTERIIAQESVINKDRMNIRIVVETELELFSIKDGSSVKAQGVGDGLATGTAVAGNIASTNAFKNVLLRLFMITEQSVEDAAKTEVPSGPAAGSAVARAQNQAQKSAPPAAGAASDMKAGKDRITALIDSGKITQARVKELQAPLATAGKKGAALIEALEAAVNAEIEGK